MKKYLLKTALFFVIVAVVDVCYGIACDYFRDHAKGGVAAKLNYIIENCHEDIIMMGSSRMAHHYFPKTFVDSLGVKCYNAGFDGSGIIQSYGVLRMILERYTPKMIIYDVSGFDMYVDDNTKYLENMKPYFSIKKDCVADIFTDVNPMEKWKMNSSLYRYNSKLPRLLGDYFHPLVELEKGYNPIFRTMNYEPSTPIVSEEHVVDSLKMKYLAAFVELAQHHNIKLVFVASPTYLGKEKVRDNDPIRALSKQMNVPFIDHYYDAQLCSSNEFWADGTHMNDKGARLFSKMIVRDISKEFKKKQGRSL